MNSNNIDNATALHERLKSLLGYRLSDTTKLLGVSRSSWHEYTAKTRPMPSYISKSIEAHLALTDFDLEALADKREEQNQGVSA